MKLTQRELFVLIQDITEILCKIQEEELRDVLERSLEYRLKQNNLECDEEEDHGSDKNSDSGSDSGSDNSFFETDSDISELED